jgi:hypothetical protein
MLMEGSCASMSNEVGGAGASKLPCKPESEVLLTAHKVTATASIHDQNGKDPLRFAIHNRLGTTVVGKLHHVGSYSGQHRE